MVRGRRRRRLATAGIAILIVSLMLAGTALFALAEPVSPQQNFKDQFKAACASAGGDFVEDANTNTFRCNLKGGGAIVCPEGGGQCWYEPAGALKGILGSIVATTGNVAANPGTQGGPTPTPTKPARSSVLGGIVATIGPAKLPPDTGYLFGRSWTCPANINHDFQTLFLKCNPDTSIEFSVFGASLAQQHPHGGFSYSGLAPGNYTEREIVPNGYGVDLTTFCSVASSNQYPAANTFNPVVVYEGYYEFQLAAGQYVYCEWFNTPPSTVTPSPTRVVKGVIGGVLQNPQKVQGNSAPTATAAAGTPAP